jgi:antitoxin MazE
MPHVLDNDMPTTRIRRWGNSMGVRLPRAALAKARLAEGETVAIRPTTKGLLLIPAKAPQRRRKYSLRQLCKGMTPDKSHPEFPWGPPVGSEII